MRRLDANQNAREGVFGVGLMMVRYRRLQRAEQRLVRELAR
jgi:hypothetical protein